MDMFDFFFPEIAQASHLRAIARKPVFSSRPSSIQPDHASEVASLRSDVNFLTMVLAGILKRLAETKTMSLGDVQDLLDEIDGLDGVRNGGLEPGVLRGLLGVLKEESVATKEEQPELPQIVTDVQQRYRR